MNVVALLLAVLQTSLVAAQESALTFHPAHWVDGEALEPTFYISPLRALAFTSPSEGWVVGERYVLHIQGERLEVAFVELGESLRTLSFSSPDLGWAGSGHTDRWPMLSYRSGEWRVEPLVGIGWPYWGVSKVMSGPSGTAWAIARYSDKVPDHLEFPKMRSALLRYDGSIWTLDHELLANRPDVRLVDACQASDASWWFVGADMSAATGQAMVLARWDGKTLQTLGGAEESEQSILSRVRCLPDGTAWASGERRRRKGEAPKILLLRFTNAWERIAVPADLPMDGWASSLAPVSRDEVWISAKCEGNGADCCERFLHYRDGTWHTEGLPSLPGGRCTKVSIVDAQFVSPDEGWAIATDMEPGEGGARIFHYKDGKWRNRNWNWHFWDAPWFNLFG